MMERWNIGILEYWESKTDDGLILNYDPCHLYIIRSHSAKPIFPSFQYSTIPWPMFTPQPFFKLDDEVLNSGLQVYPEAIRQSLDGDGELIFRRIGKVNPHMVFGRILAVEHFARDKGDFEFNRLVE